MRVRDERSQTESYNLSRFELNLTYLKLSKKFKGIAKEQSQNFIIGNVNSSVGAKINMSSIEERVKKIVCEQLGVKEDEVKASASFVDDLGADSLDTVELVMALEEEFETEIPDEEAEKITTVQLAIDYINENL